MRRRASTRLRDFSGAPGRKCAGGVRNGIRPETRAREDARRRGVEVLDGPWCFDTTDEAYLASLRNWRSIKYGMRTGRFNYLRTM